MNKIIIFVLILITIAIPWHYTVKQPVIVQKAPIVSHPDYPSIWANSPKDTLVDSWGQSNRECGSYAAYKVWEKYKFNINATWGIDWKTSAEKRGITVDHNPTAGSVGWFMNAGGSTSHVAWIDHINKDASVHVSQYNTDYTGHYSEANWTPNPEIGTIWFIHFDQVEDFHKVSLFVD